MKLYLIGELRNSLNICLNVDEWQEIYWEINDATFAKIMYIQKWKKLVEIRSNVY